MVATFLVVFVIIFSSLNATRKPLPQAVTDPPTGETSPPTTEMTTIGPTNTWSECPILPKLSYEGMGWIEVGQVVDGNIKYFFDLARQPVAISHDGNRVVLGSPWDDGSINNEGLAIVKVLDFNGNTWEEIGSFSGRNEDRYGMSISLSGDGKRLAIGAAGTDEWSGQVETHEYIEKTRWKSIGQKLNGTNFGDLFGYSIALSNDGSRIVIGTDRSDMNGEDSGSVSVFELEDNTWKQLGQTIPGNNAGDRFGFHVSLSGDGSIVAVGADRSQENGSESGSAHVFQYSSEKKTIVDADDKQINQSMQNKGKWVQVAQILLGEASGDRFGTSLSINAKGDTLVVGSYGGNYVKVFHYDGNEWLTMGQTLVGKILFGYSVFLAPNANRFAVGFADNNGWQVNIIDFDENNLMEIGNLVSSEMFYGTSFSLSSCGERLAIGSIHDNNGRFRVYEFK